MKKNTNDFYWITTIANAAIALKISETIYDKVWAKMFKKTDNLLTTSIVSVSTGVVSQIAVFCALDAILVKTIKVTRR